MKQILQLIYFILVSVPISVTLLMSIQFYAFFKYIKMLNDRATDTEQKDKGA